MTTNLAYKPPYALCFDSAKKVKYVLFISKNPDCYDSQSNFK